MLLLVVGISDSGLAFQNTWQFRKYNYWVNSGSFVYNITGVSLTGAEARHWVKYASSVWTTRTGAWVTAPMASTIALECYDHGSASYNHDGYNVVSAIPGCRGGGTTNCSEAGFTKRWTSGWFGTGYLVEADVCISNSQPGTGGPDNWQVSGFGDDLVGVLIHEMGHALGMEHPQDFNPPGPSETVMDFFNSTSIRYRGRVPFGWDHDQLRSMYGSITHSRHWRRWDGTSWTVAHSMPGSGSDWQQPGATIAKKNGSNYQYVVAAAVDRYGDRIYFNSSPTPLTSSSTWSSGYITADTYRSPALAWNLQSGSSAIAVAAWPRRLHQEGNTCILETYASNDLFVSGTKKSFWNGQYCTLLQPALSYDRKSGRFVLAYLHHDPNNGSYHNEVLAMTSINGTSWTAPQPLGIKSTTAPGLACNYGDCLLTIGRLDQTQPWHQAWKLNVTSSGSVIQGTATQVQTPVQYRPDAGLYYKSGSGWRWLTTHQYSSTTHLPSIGVGDLYLHEDNTLPPAMDSWSVVDDSYFPGTWASHPFSFDAYLIYNSY